MRYVSAATAKALTLRWAAASIVAAMMVGSPSNCQAQSLADLLGLGGDHHHHDGAGHRVDDHGHHIDLMGNHTGSVGVFDDGDYDVPNYGQPQGYSSGVTTYNGMTGYWANGVFYYYTNPAQVGGPSNAVPQTVVANRPPQNVLPTAYPQQLVGGSITILNPAETGGDVRYSLNGIEYSIRPGQSQVINSDRTWVISFGSGGPRGDVRYTLSPGTFRFKTTAVGWDLTRLIGDTGAVQATVPSPPAPIPPSIGGQLSQAALP